MIYLRVRACACGSRCRRRFRLPAALLTGLRASMHAVGIKSGLASPYLLGRMLSCCSRHASVVVRKSLRLTRALSISGGDPTGGYFGELVRRFRRCARSFLSHHTRSPGPGSQSGVHPPARALTRRSISESATLSLQILPIARTSQASRSNSEPTKV